MDLDFSEEQNLFRETARSICEQYYDLTVVREQERHAGDYPNAFWQALIESGLTGIAIDENHGGAGLGLLDAVVIFEELGRTLSVSPMLSSCILAAKLIALAGSEQQKQQWLPLIASGEIIVSCAHLETGGGFDEEGVQLLLASEQLTGRKTLVPFANSATHLLVLARDEASQLVVPVLVEAESAGIRCTHQPSIGSAANYTVEFKQAAVIARFESGDNQWGQWQQAMAFAAVALAAQSVGSAEQMLSFTAEYSKTRQQFGKPIGQFQALSHMMAELATDIEGSKTLVYQAAWACDSGRPWQLLAAQSKLHSADTVRRTTAVGTQIHGGIGFTLEADPQLYYRRAKQQQLEHWDAEYLERYIAHLLLDNDVKCY